MQFGERLRRERRRRHLSQETLAEVLGCSPKTIRRWENQQAFPQAHHKLQISRFFGIRQEEWFTEDREAIHSALLWNIPYPRNPFFTGREEILHQLNKLLHQESLMAQSRPWAVTGPGGIGKTQIVLEYVYQYHEEYRFVFWTNAATRKTLLTDIAVIANLLHLPECNGPDQKQLIQAVKRWFATHSEWLWILDNVEDFALVRDAIPAAYSGHLLLVSRAQALGTLAQRIEVETMGLVEGMQFLLSRIKLLAPDAFLDQVAQTHLTAAETIVTEMDAFPLALDQAGAYMEESGCDPSTYLGLYYTHRRELLQRRGHTPTDHPESISATWFRSLQKIERSNAIAADLLSLCAFLGPDSIPEELISEGISYCGPIEESRNMDVFQLNAAIEELRKFSLVRRSSETRTVQVPRLVQIAIKDMMSVDNQRHWAQRAVQVTESMFPATIEASTRDLCKRYLPQAQACSVLIQDYALTCEKAASLLFRTATSLQEYDFYEQAESLYLQALQIYEQAMGPNYPEIARLMNSLSRFFYIQQKYEQAKSFTQQMLQIYEQMLGANHPEAPLTPCRLVHLLQQQSLCVNKSLRGVSILRLP